MKTEFKGKMQLVKQELEVWGDRCLFTIPKDEMPPEGEVFVMIRESYSTQPHTVKRMPDGSGQIEIFYSRD